MSTCANMSYPSSVADLLLKAGTGDRSAGEQIVARYTGLVRSVVARFGLQESDVADVVQSTWLRLFTHSVSIRDPEKLGGWLSTTARREALALIRRRQAEIASESVGDRLAALEPAPEDLVMIDETRAAVRAATDELTECQKLVVDALFYQSTGSYEEVSRRTGLPVGSIGPTRGRALRRIQQRLCEPEPIEHAGQEWRVRPTAKSRTRTNAPAVLPHSSTPSPRDPQRPDLTCVTLKDQGRL